MASNITINVNVEGQDKLNTLTNEVNTLQSTLTKAGIPSVDNFKKALQDTSIAIKDVGVGFKGIFGEIEGLKKRFEVQDIKIEPFDRLVLKSVDQLLSAGSSNFGIKGSSGLVETYTELIVGLRNKRATEMRGRMERAMKEVGDPGTKEEIQDAWLARLKNAYKQDIVNVTGAEVALRQVRLAAIVQVAKVQERGSGSVILNDVTWTKEQQKAFLEEVGIAQGRSLEGNIALAGKLNTEYEAMYSLLKGVQGLTDAVPAQQSTASGKKSEGLTTLEKLLQSGYKGQLKQSIKSAIGEPSPVSEFELRGYDKRAQNLTPIQTGAKVAESKMKLQRVSLLEKSTPIEEKVKEGIAVAKKEYGMFFAGLESGLASIGNAVTKYFHNQWVKAVGGANSVAQQFFVRVMDNLTQIGVKAASSAVVSGLLSFIPGVGGFSDIFKSIFKFQTGGYITEPVLGIGMRSRVGYMLGEAGPERVTPMSSYSIGQQGRFGTGQIMVQPSVKVVPIVSSGGLAVQVEVGNRINRSRRTR